MCIVRCVHVSRCLYVYVYVYMCVDVCSLRRLYIFYFLSCYHKLVLTVRSKFFVWLSFVCVYVCVCLFVFVRACVCVSPGIAGICRFLYISILSFCLAFVYFVFLLRQFSKVSATFVGAGVELFNRAINLRKGENFYALLIEFIYFQVLLILFLRNMLHQSSWKVSFLIHIYIYIYMLYLIVNEGLRIIAIQIHIRHSQIYIDRQIR